MDPQGQQHCRFGECPAGGPSLLPVSAFSAYSLLRNCNYLLNAPSSDIGRFRNLELPLRSPDTGDVNPPLLNKALITPSLFGYSHMCLTPNEPISGKSPVELSPCSPLYSSPNFRRQRGEKKPIPDEQKDEKYYERRRRNNQAAKKSRDARKIREDQVALRATILEHENAILRAQVLTLREEASSLRQMLLQKKALELATRDSQICIT